jgi:hypothetical protein
MGWPSLLELTQWVRKELHPLVFPCRHKFAFSSGLFREELHPLISWCQHMSPYGLGLFWEASEKVMKYHC